jgi:hypothetical protein
MLAEKFAGINPYQFGFNNPVMFNDPSGDQPGNGRVTNGRQQKGPDGNYHVGWYNEMLWNNAGFYDWRNQGDASGDYFNIQGASSSRILSSLSLGQSYNSVYGPKDYSKAWQNIFSSLQSGNNKVTYKNTPGGSGAISGYYYGNQSGSGEYVRQEYGGETTYAASEDYYYTGYIAAVDFSTFLDGGGGGGLGTNVWQAGLPPASKGSGWGISFYDGVPIISSPWVEHGAAFTPGPFIIKSPEINPHTSLRYRDLVRHEIGHTATFFAMGGNYKAYLTIIAIPSVVNYLTGLGGDHNTFYTEKIANNFAEWIYGPFTGPDKIFYPTYNF